MPRSLTAVFTLSVKCDAPGCTAAHEQSETARDNDYVGDPQGRVYIKTGNIGWVIGTANNVAYCPQHRNLGIAISPLL